MDIIKDEQDPILTTDENQRGYLCPNNIPIVNSDAPSFPDDPGSPKSAAAGAEKKEEEASALPKAKSEPWEQIEQYLTQVYAKMEQLEIQFATRLKYDEFKDQIIDRLHAELQAYKNDLVSQIKLPIINDLVSLQDDFAKILSSSRDNISKLTPEQCLSILQDLHLYILDILEKQDVYSFQNDLPQFDPKTQQALGIATTDNPENGRIVKERLRPGFKLNEKIIRPEGVIVYRYEPLKTPDQQNTTE